MKSLLIHKSGAARTLRLAFIQELKYVAESIAEKKKIDGRCSKRIA